MQTPRFFFKLLILSSTFLIASCLQEERAPDNPLGNFEELWKIIDERYCFLEYKKIDWDKIYLEYKQQITPDLSDYDLFYLLGNMLAELKDGHVNLYSDNNIIYYQKWFEEYPRNFSGNIVMNYLGKNYRTEGGIKYTILNGNTGYMYCESFSDAIDTENINAILTYMSKCNSLIIDIRNNGGGSIGNCTRLASHFTNKKTLTGYIRHKTGKAHNSFSSAKAIYVQPSSGIRWQKKVAVLTNRRTYSAANYFVNHMRYFPQVTIIGDVTGGGSGLPFTSELPNGWGIRFSTSPHFDADMNHIEFGISPHIKVNMNAKDEAKGIDTIIENALKQLNKQQ